MRKIKFHLVIIIGLCSLIWACSHPEVSKPNANPSPYKLEYSDKFPTPSIPTDNPLTNEGVQLGRMLFYDPILSLDSTISCASCHKQENAFSDSPNQFSKGVSGQAFMGANASALINVAWQNGMFWDGRSPNLEEQALHPITNSNEMGETKDNVLKKLQRSGRYKDLFLKAFGTGVNEVNLRKALAQFERTIISDNSKFDRFFPDSDKVFTAAEFRGKNIFFSEVGDCFHCHGGILAQDVNSNLKAYSNNGLDADVTGKGYGKTTGKADDDGKFKVPTLRNWTFTAPYMHDGRFKTIDEVVEHYSSGIQESNTLDVIFRKFDRVAEGGLQLTADQKSDLIAYLKTLNDSSFVKNKNLSSPF